MFFKSSSSRFLAAVALLGTSAGQFALADGIRKGHWYSDPTSAIHSTSTVEVSGQVGPSGSCCPHSLGTMSGELHASPHFVRSNCPPPTNALLRVWVNECAKVWVNGTLTKPQMLAGANQGSRILSLTGLQPTTINEAVVRAEMLDGVEPVIVERKVLVQAGKKYEVRITDAEFGPVVKMAQVDFTTPERMHVSWDADGAGHYDSGPVVTPGRREFLQGGTYNLKLAPAEHPGIERYPTLELPPTTRRTSVFLAHNTIPIKFTAKDFQAVVDGKFVTKVIYLSHGPASPGVCTLTSPGSGPDPIAEANRQGEILAIVRLGNIDREILTRKVEGESILKPAKDDPFINDETE